MKKTLQLFIFISICCNAQIAYYDAVELKKIISTPLNDASFAQVSKILINYLPDSIKNDPDLTEAAIQVLNAGNPFIPEYLKYSVPSSPSRVSKTDLKLKVAGLNVTNPAQGISLFMIDRAKAELNVAFFQQFKKFVEKNQEFQVLFPKTTGVMGNLLTYQYTEMISVLRTAFDEDVNMLPLHIDDVFELPKYLPLMEKFPEIRIAIQSMRLIHELETENLHAYEIINKFDSLDAWKTNYDNLSPGFKNARNALKLSSIFSNSVRSNDNKRAWVTPKELSVLIKDSIAFRMYMGLIYAQVSTSKIHFLIPNKSDTLFLTDKIQKNAKTTIIFQAKLSEFIELANRVDKHVIEIKKKKEEEITNEDIHKYITTSIDIIDYSFNIGRIFNPDFISNDYVKIARSGNDLYKNIYSKQYPAAISNVMCILTTTFEAIETNVSRKEKTVTHKLTGDKELSAKKEKRLTDKLDVANKDLIQAKVHVNDVLENLEKVMKYATFVANVATAKTAEEVSAVIESAVLPVGSSSIKKSSALNISIQSYLGLGFNASNSKKATSWNSMFFVSAPIGISIGRQFLHKGGSISAFGSLLDLGAIVDYQLTYDTSSTATPQISKDYKIELGQIFSPGAYVVYGCHGNIPLALGFGAQYGPGLNRISSSGATVVDNPSWRWGAFLSVDIPFFTLYNKPKKTY